MSKSSHEILGVATDATKDEIKKAYRKLAAKYHPDVNKDADAEQKFKEITSAYELLENPRHTPEPSRAWGGGGQSWSATPSKIIQFPPLQTSIKITFAESVLGCKKNIDVSKYIRCESCLGQGGHATIDSCPECNGRGQKVTRRGPMTFVEQCGVCGGFGKKFEDCSSCQGQGGILTDKNFEVSIPGAIQDKQIIRLGGGGHFQSSPFGVGYADAFITVLVESTENMQLVGLNVISTLEVTLLEAMEGTTKTIKTVHGDNKIDVPKLSRNKDELYKHGMGAVSQGRAGLHVFILDVKYPSGDVSGLIETLKRME